MRVFIKKNGALLIYAAMALLAFYEIVHAASAPLATQLWGDEYYSLEAAMMPSIPEALKFVAQRDGNGVLFDFLLFFWYRIVPYGDTNLLLFPAIFTSLSVFTIGAAGRKIGGNICGFAAAILLLINTTFMQFGNELRAYALSMLLSALIIYVYASIAKDRNNIKIKHLVVYGLLTLLAVLTNYHAMFACIILFAVDVVYVIKSAQKRRAARILLSYASAAVLFLPWGIFWTKNVIANHLSWQNHTPTVTDFFAIIKELCSYNNIVFFITLCAIAYFIVSAIRNKRVHVPAFTYMTAFVGFILVMFVSSFALTVFFKKGGFWISRYFLLIVPFGIITAASFVAITLETLQKHYKAVCSVTLIAGFLFFAPQTYTALAKTPSPTEQSDWLTESADWIYLQPDIYDDDVALYATIWGSFFHYTLEQEGRRPALNYIKLWAIPDSINKIYTIAHRDNIDFSDFGVEDKFEMVDENKDLRIQIWQRKDT